MRGSVPPSENRNRDREPEVSSFSRSQLHRPGSILSWAAIAALVYAILVAVGTIGSGFKWVSGGQEGAAALFSFATNPFMGLVVGTLATALIQSSSTVTSIIVGLVAGGLPVSMAIPMIMGANIGTTITNTLVSLGHIREKAEFRRAFSAATVHDFFNVFSVVIFLPLEMSFNFLERTSDWIMSAMALTGTGLSMKSLDFLKPITMPAIATVKTSLKGLPEPFGGILMIILGIGLIIVAITLIGQLLKAVMVGRAKHILHSALGRGPVTGIASGTFVTVLVQSSSTTTSLAVPLAGSGLFTAKDIYPFTLGANIGTCITALLAATAISGPNANFAMQIAIIHLIYNVFGVVVIYGLPFLRNIPLRCSEWLAAVAAERKVYAFAYILAVFFVLPGMLVAMTN